MLFVARQNIVDAEVLLEGVTDGIEAAVARRGDGDNVLAVLHFHDGGDAVLLLVVHLADVEAAAGAQEPIAEELEELLWFEFLVLLVRDVLGKGAHRLAHFGGELDVVALFEDVPHAALARLRVDADDVRIVDAADVARVDGKIGNIPHAAAVLGAPVHALGDGVLMGARERREDELARIGLTGRNSERGELFVGIRDGGHIGKIQPGIDALRIHIHGEGDDIAVARALAVAEEGAFDAVGARKEAELRRRDARAAVVVGMKGQNDVLAVLHVLVHVLDLLRVDVRHGVFHRGGKVDDRLPLCRGLPDIEDGVDDFERVLGLGAREALGRIFEAVLLARLFGELLQKLRAVDGDLLDLLFGLFEDLLALGDGGRIIDVDDDVLGALDRLEGAADDVLARLREHLDGDVVGDEVLLDEGAKEGVLRLARGGEAHLDLLEADPKEQFEKFELGLQRHGLDERLVAVAQIDAAPDGRSFHHVFFRPIHAALGRKDELFAVLVVLHESLLT